jgi:hypothetical protein
MPVEAAIFELSGGVFLPLSNDSRNQANFSAMICLNESVVRR